MTSSCVNGALCCPTRGRYWKISAEGFHDVLQNLSCPKQFRLCRQVQLFIVVFYSSPSFFFALLVSCLLSRCCQERCNPPIDGSDCQRDGRSSQDRSCSPNIFRGSGSERIIGHLQFPNSPWGNKMILGVKCTFITGVVPEKSCTENVPKSSMKATRQNSMHKSHEYDVEWTFKWAWRFVQSLWGLFFLVRWFKSISDRKAREI